MAEYIKILGQSAPTATTLTTVYTVSASLQTVISSIGVCNTSTTATDSFRISIAQGGAVDAATQYIYRDVAIAPKDTFMTTIGITLAETDVVRVYSTNGTSNFVVFGVESDSSTSGATITVASGSATYTGISKLTISGSAVVTNPASGEVSMTFSGTGGGSGVISPYDVWYYV